MKIQITKEVTKKQLRHALGISQTTMTQHMKAVRHLLLPLGYRDTQHLLTIPQAQVFADYYCIHPDDLPTAPL